jgi:hypothetical protein
MQESAMSPEVYVKAQVEIGGTGLLFFLITLSLLLAIGIWRGCLVAHNPSACTSSIERTTAYRAPAASACR